MATFAPQINYTNYPLKDIPQPHPHDVLCGRGGGTNNHIGNSHWRMLVAANKQLYIALPKRQKMLLSRSIVNAVRSQNPPGRFLQKESKTNLWFDVGDQRAQEKTSQALREGAPDIRKKVAAAQSGDKETTTEDEENGEDENGGGGEGDDENNRKVTKGQGDDDAGQEKDDSKIATSKKPAPNASKSNKGGGVAGGVMGSPVNFMHPSSGINNNNNNTMYEGYSSPASSLQGMTFPFGAAAAATAHVEQQQGMQQMLSAMHMMNGNDPQQQAMMAMHMMGGIGGTAAGMNTNNNNFMSPQMMHAQQQYMEQQRQQQQHMHQNMTGGHNNNGSGDFDPLPIHGCAQDSRNAKEPYNNGNDDEAGAYQHDSGYNYHHNYDSTKKTPTFDEFVAAPDGLDTGGLSFGSIGMTDAEMKKLEAGGASFGSNAMRFSNHGMRSSMPNNTNYQSHHMREQQMHHHAQPQQHQGSSNAHDDAVVPAAPDALDGGVGLSFGDVSMMSAGTNGMKLDDTGTSFGTMMSGLEAIGTSFGSLSLDTSHRDALYKQLELAASGPEIQPQHKAEKKSSGNLLECSDTESENSEEKEKLVKQKSQAWERMKSQIATEQPNFKAQGSVGSGDLMPPPAVGRPFDADESSNKTHPFASEVAIPTTTLEDNFSTLSAWSAADDFNEDPGAMPPPPPQALKKEGHEW